jgi:hypothetical protein
VDSMTDSKLDTPAGSPVITNPHVAYAVRIVRAVCSLAGQSSFVDDVRASLRRQGIGRAVQNHDTPAIFDWLMEALSYQGISDAIAADFIEQHGTVRWRDIADALAQQPACPKLGGYWLFHDCGFEKTSGSCNEPSRISTCPLPGHRLRNGHLNQTAYSLFLFMRDIADGDFVCWIDQQLRDATNPGAERLARLREAVIEPLLNVYGVGKKVLAMALSSLLMGADGRRKLWFEVGADFVAVDTLVHNFLHRTGILRRLLAKHAYGPACYQPGGCAAIIRSIAAQIDAGAFNPSFPAVFPRFVQHAIWAYCAQSGLGICNGNRLDDAHCCENTHCQLFRGCDRVALRASRQKRESLQ